MTSSIAPNYNGVVEELDKLAPEALARAERRLLHPAPSSRAAAAREFGVDLTLLVEQLRLTPAERATRMLELCRLAEDMRGLALRKKS